MKKSEPILPLPIYDDLFDQQRFNSLCEPDCQQQLIFPTNALPLFQFVRDKSLEIPSTLVLRNACTDKTQNFYKIIQEGWGMYDQKFIDIFGGLPTSGAIYDDGVNPPVGTTIEIGKTDCGVLKEKALPPFYTILGETNLIVATPAGAKINFKISIDLFYRQTAFTIKVYDGIDNTGILIGTISAAGIYNYNFDLQNGAITLVFDNYLDGDKYSISYMQASYWNPLELQLFANDIVMSYSDIKIKQTAENKDIVTFCDTTTQYAIPPGDYYYTLVMDDEIYFSEVFSLKTPKELEKYYRLYWRHTCDITDTVIYAPLTLLCLFYNVIYLDAALFNAEYPTTDDGQENGYGDRESIFKRWQKSIKLEIPKSPPYLTDALTAVFLHDTILLRNPINSKKDTANSDYTIKIGPTEVTDILSDCYQNVKMNLILNERFINKNCCDPIELFDCTPTQTPTLDNVSEPLPGVFLLEGTVLPNTFAVVEHKLNGGSWVQTDIYESMGADEDFAILFDTNDLGAITDLDVRIRSKTLACDKGVSNEMDLI